MADIGVDSNFKRLEEEVNRLLEVLEQLRGENAGLRERVVALDAAQQELAALRQRLAGVEEEHRQSIERSQLAKERLERILSRLEAADL